MATFELTAPDGNVYEIDAADEAAAVKAVEHAFGGGKAQEPGVDMGAPDPVMQQLTGEVLSGDAKRSRAAQVQNEYDLMPWYKKAGQAADDIVRLGAEGLTFGYADKIAGALGGEGVEAERQKTEDARSRAGSAGMVAEYGSGMLGAGKLANAGLTAGRLVPAGMKGAAGLAARTGAMAVDGAALGALSATGHDTDVGEGALYGAIGGAAGNLAGEGLAKVAGKAAGLFNKKPQIMTREQLEAASQAAYKAADDAGVILKPQAVQRLARELQDDLAEFGYMPQLQPKVGTFLGSLDEMAQGNITLKGMDQLRKVAGLIAKSNDPAEQAVATQIIKKIDKHLDKLNVGDILTGDKTQGVRALQSARKLWASAKKSEMIENALERAKNNASSGGTGGNIDNAIRQQFRSILNNPKKSRGLTADERIVMQAIVRGTKGQNLARLVGRLSPQGNGLMLLIHGTGGVVSGGASLPLAAVGAGAKAIADGATSRNVEQLSRIVRAGGDASATRAAPNAVQRLAQAKRDALARQLGILGAISPQSAGAQEPE